MDHGGLADIRDIAAAVAETDDARLSALPGPVLLKLQSTLRLAGVYLPSRVPSVPTAAPSVSHSGGTRRGHLRAL